MTALKPCPFCGGEAVDFEDGGVTCPRCSAETDSIDAWNRRVVGLVATLTLASDLVVAFRIEEAVAKAEAEHRNALAVITATLKHAEARAEKAEADCAARQNDITSAVKVLTDAGVALDVHSASSMTTHARSVARQSAEMLASIAEMRRCLERAQCQHVGCNPVDTHNGCNARAILARLGSTGAGWVSPEEHAARMRDAVAHLRIGDAHLDKMARDLATQTRLKEIATENLADALVERDAALAVKAQLLGACEAIYANLHPDTAAEHSPELAGALHILVSALAAAKGGAT